MPEKWDQVKELFSLALEREPGERSTFLCQACAGDDSLRAEIESLLSSFDGAATFLEDSPAADLLSARSRAVAGMRIGAYRVIREIGQGGMAVVYLGERDDQNYRKQVAIKMVKSGIDTEQVLQRFRNERQTLAALDHSNIVKLLDGGSSEDGSPYLVMECVEGLPIDRYCDLNKLSIDDRLRLFCEVCSAVQYAHDNLVIHRDLKPGNILIAKGGVPRLLDFGIAKLLNPECVQTPLATRTNWRPMTLEYASPEQIRGHAITPATDVYSLGVLLFELLTGHRPYRSAGQSLLEMERLVCESEPERPSAVIYREEVKASRDGDLPIAVSPEWVSNQRGLQPTELQRRLRGDLDTIVMKALRKEPERRYASVEEFSQDIERYLTGRPVKARKPTIAYRSGRFLHRHKESLAAALVVLGMVAMLAGAGYFLFYRPNPKLTDKETVVLGDFTNTTGDVVFNDVLKQALAVELGQSPFLNVLSDRKVSETLAMMGRPANEPITAEVGRELCLRTGSKALLDGTISSLGSHYLVGLNAVACTTGDTLAKEQGEATSKEDVLKALSRASSSLRTKLGESLPSVQKFDVPLDATTSSLEALKNYSMGITIEREKGDAPSIPFLKRAIELDPNFPLAYAQLAIEYGNLLQPSLALEYATKAYQLRDRVSEREKLRITAFYFRATGELDKEAHTYELWAANYPRDDAPHTNLGFIYSSVGQYDKALAEYQESLRLAPEDVLSYRSLGAAYLNLNRLDEAKASLDQAFARKLDGGDLREYIYLIAFLRGDAVQMEQQVAWSAGKPGDEDLLLSAQSDTEAYYGRMNKARGFSRRAVDSAVGADSEEAAALWQVNAALREAELGNAALARRGVRAALALSPGRDVKVWAALTLARVGDAARARELGKELEKAYPTNTMVKLYWLPVINAAIELSKGNSSPALVDLEAAAPYELGGTGMFINYLYPVYVRGQAYLLARDGTAATAEFQKVMDHKGTVQNFVTGSLAHLQIGRAYAMAGDTAKAKVAYQDFFTLWRDADPDIPVLKQAKAEYAKVQ